MWTWGASPHMHGGALWAAQPLVRWGMRWQVGDGTQIKAWKDKWIPSPRTYKVVTLERVSVTLLMKIARNGRGT